MSKDNSVNYFGSVVMRGRRIFLRSLQRSDCTDTYLSWLRDDRVRRYMNQPQNLPNRADLVKYVESTVKSDDYLFGIFLNAGDQHIGNINLSHIDLYHYRGAVGLILGPEFQGQRYGYEALDLMIDFAFKKVRLNKLYCGMVANNVASKRLFLSKGFQLDGVLRAHFWDHLSKTFLDCCEMSLISDEYERQDLTQS